MREAALLIKRIKDYGQEQNWNKHEIDLLEETEELMMSGLTQEQKQKEFGRVGSLLEQKMGQESRPAVSAERTDREAFVKKLQSRLAQCQDKVYRLGRQRAMEAGPEIDLLKGELRGVCDAKANYQEMKHRQNFRKIFMSKVENFNIRLRTMAGTFVQEIMAEYDRCFGQIKRQLTEAELPEFKISEKEWYQSGGKNIDMLQSEAKASADYLKLDQAPFETFAQECGVKVEHAARGHKRMTDLIRLLPIIIYIGKYILDTYILQSESMTEKILNALLEWIAANGEKSMDEIIKVLEFVLPLLKEGSEAVAFGVDLIFTLIFFGWLYFIYLVIVNRIRKNSLVTRLQACMEEQINGFLGGINLEDMVQSSFESLEERIKNLYQEHYAFLNQRLALAAVEREMEEASGIGGRLSAFYEEYKRLGKKGAEF